MQRYDKTLKELLNGGVSGGVMVGSGFGFLDLHVRCAFEVDSELVICPLQHCR